LGYDFRSISIKLALSLLNPQLTSMGTEKEDLTSIKDIDNSKINKVFIINLY